MILNKANILEKIKSNGYWRINFRPSIYQKDVINSIESLNLIQKNIVDFAGWDFPHYPTHNEDFQKIEFGDGYCQALANFGPYKEFWRFYDSAQFIAYIGFPEDWYNEHFWEERRERLKHIIPGKYIGFFYSIVNKNCQIFTFVKNLAEKGIYNNGLEVNIKLFNTKDREIWGQGKFWRARVSIFKTESNIITAFNESINFNDILTKYWDYANQSIKKIISAFGISLDSEEIKLYQEQIKQGK